MKTNSWLYHYYMVQSRLQYGLAYGAHSPGLPYYPHMLGAPAQPQPFAAYDPAYLSSGHHNFGNSGVASSLSSSLSSPLYPSYLYSPPHHYLQPPPPACAHRHARHPHQPGWRQPGCLPSRYDQPCVAPMNHV